MARMPGNLELSRGGPSEGESAASRFASATRKPAHGDSRGNTAADLLARGSLGGGSARSGPDVTFGLRLQRFEGALDGECEPRLGFDMECDTNWWFALFSCSEPGWDRTLQVQ